MKITTALMIAGLLTLPLASVSVQAAPTPSLQERFDTLGMGVAIGGFDPVSYFPEGGGKP